MECIAEREKCICVHEFELILISNEDDICIIQGLCLFL